MDFYQGLQTEMCLCNTELCNTGHPRTKATNVIVVLCLTIAFYFIIIDIQHEYKNKLFNILATII